MARETWRTGKAGKTDHKVATCRKCGKQIEIREVYGSNKIPDYLEWIQQAQWQVGRINLTGAICPDCQTEKEKFPTELALMPIRSELKRQILWCEDQLKTLERSKKLYELYLSKIQ